MQEIRDEPKDIHGGDSPKAHEVWRERRCSTQPVEDATTSTPGIIHQRCGRPMSTDAQPDFSFVPCPLRRIPRPALLEYRQIFEDLDFDEDGLLHRAFSGWRLHEFVRT